jgi:hypothetical protein
VVKSAAATAASFGSPNEIDDHGSDCGVPQLRQRTKHGAEVRRGSCGAAPQILDAIQTAPKSPNNQTEYEALLFGLIVLRSMGVKHVEAYGDSLLVVQQVASEFQCLEGSLRASLSRCLP